MKHREIKTLQIKVKTRRNLQKFAEIHGIQDEFKKEKREPEGSAYKP
jgi:hypothetical protein